MEDDRFHSEPVVEVAAIEQGVHGEVIALLHVLFFCIFMIGPELLIFVRCAFVLFPYGFPCRMRNRCHETVLLMSQIQRWLSLRDNRRIKRTRTQSFIKFESNLLTSPASLLRCAACDVFLLFGPSTRLMSLVWRMSLS